MKPIKEDLAKRCTPEETTKAWSETAAIVKKYSDEMVDGWNKTMDAFLTFVSHAHDCLHAVVMRCIGRSILGGVDRL